MRSPRWWWMWAMVATIMGCQGNPRIEAPPISRVDGDSLATVWKSRGDSARDRQNIPLALHAYGRGLKALRHSHFDLDSATHLLGGELSHSVASQYAKLAATDSARHYARQAILAKSWYYGIDAPEVAKSYTILAQTHQNVHQFAAAVALRRKVLKIRQAAPTVTPREMAIAWFNLGDGLMDVEDLAGSTRALDSAQSYLPRLGHGDSLLIVYNLLHAKARLAQASGRYPAALLAIEDWRRLSQSLGGASPGDHAKLLVTAGNVAREMKDWDAAIRYYHEALLLFAPGNAAYAPPALPPLERLGHDPNVFAALALMARAMAFHPDPTVAQYWVRTADLGFQFWDGLRRGFWQWDVQADATHPPDSEFEFAMRTAIAQGRAAQAFEWLERSKENDLLDVVQDLHRLNLAPVPADTIALARRYLAQIETAPQFQDSLDLLLQAIRRSHPGQMQPQPVFATLPALRDRIQGDSTLFVSYFWGPQYLVMAAATASADTMLALQLRADLVRAVADYRRALQRDDGTVEVYSQAATKVYDGLLRPLVDGICSGVLPKRLIVSPHGPLANIPFEALTTAPAQKGDGFRDLPYLLGSTAISYAHSATLWLAYQDTSILQGGVLGIGASGGYRNTGKLQNVVDEVESVVGRLGGLAMIDDVNSEHTIKTKAMPYAILHAAAHGEFIPDAPLLSRLYFPDDPGRGEDGDLHAYEVMRLRLPHQMAVLSACETGPGKVMRGREVMSMGYAFQVARCSTVVMSLWNVHDHSTRKIMDAFYAEIAKGLPVAAAFTTARRQYLATTSSPYTHPCFWAPWLLAGNGELRFEAKQVAKAPGLTRWIGWLGGIAGVGILVAWMLVRRRRRRWTWH